MADSSPSSSSASSSGANAAADARMEAALGADTVTTRKRKNPPAAAAAAAAAAPKKKVGRPKLPLNQNKKAIEKAAAAKRKEANAKKKRQPKVKPPARGKRSRNWTNEEDVFFCRAFINISQDSCVGNDQSADTFHQRVHKKFCELYMAEATETPRTLEWLAQRDVMAIKRRKNVMMTACKQWNASYNAIKAQNKSGQNDEDITADAKLDYLNRSKDEFKFLHCMPTLNTFPACLVLEGRKSDEPIDVDGENTINLGSVAGSNLKRPVGQKAAKALAKEEQSTKSLATRKTVSQENVALGHCSLATTMRRRQEVDHIKAIAMMYLEAGEKDEWKLCMYELKDLRAKHKAEDDAIAAKEAAEEESVPEEINVARGPAQPSMSTTTNNTQPAPESLPPPPFGRTESGEPYFSRRN